MTSTATHHQCPECGHLCNVLPPATAAACAVCSRVFAVNTEPQPKAPTDITPALEFFNRECAGETPPHESHTMKHTPTPWHIVNRSTLSKFTADWREIGPNVIMATSFDRTRDGETETHCGVKINEANADFIVLACNNHDRLLASLKQLIPILEIGEDVPMYIVKEARQAIASVEGKV